MVIGSTGSLSIGIYRTSSAQSAPGARPQGDRHPRRRRQLRPRNVRRVRRIREELAPRTPARGDREGQARCRLIAGINGLDGGAVFAERYELDPERAAEAPAKCVGRMLMLPHAKRLLKRLER
jgi:hypothetical protein